MNIKVDSRNLPETIEHLQKTWNTFCPDFLFEYSFLDKNYERLYNDEMRLGRLFFYLAMLAIFIASIGLMGLSSFLAEQRIKEIGIRKATGDTTQALSGCFQANLQNGYCFRSYCHSPGLVYYEQVAERICISCIG